MKTDRHQIIHRTLEEDAKMVAVAITLAQPISDMEPDGLENVARRFLEAHRAAPGGLSVEIGSRGGGSAILQLVLLEYLYGVDRPMLFTVDPYGGKPYRSTDRDQPASLYGDDDYLHLKLVTYRMANHAHWYCRGEDFLEGMAHRPFWWHGKRHTLQGTSFVLLDGEHNATTVAREFSLLVPLVDPRGIVLIDNTDKDDLTVEKITPTWRQWWSTAKFTTATQMWWYRICPQ